LHVLREFGAVSEGFIADSLVELERHGWDAGGDTPARLLGRPMHLRSGIARLARETGAPIVPAFTWREGNGQVGVLGEPIDPAAHPDETSINAAIGAVVDAVVAPRRAQVHIGIAKRLGSRSAL
jgi:lauroyl/myristoyl acyltransferase